MYALKLLFGLGMYTRETFNIILFVFKVYYRSLSCLPVLIF